LLVDRDADRAAPPSEGSSDVASLENIRLERDVPVPFASAKDQTLPWPARRWVAPRRSGTVPSTGCRCASLDRISAVAGVNAAAPASQIGAHIALKYRPLLSPR